MNFMLLWQEEYLTSEILLLPLKHKIHIFSPPYLPWLYMYLPFLYAIPENIHTHPKEG